MILLSLQARSDLSLKTVWPHTFTFTLVSKTLKPNETISSGKVKDKDKLSGLEVMLLLPQAGTEGRSELENCLADKWRGLAGKTVTDCVSFLFLYCAFKCQIYWHHCHQLRPEIKYFRFESC